MITPNHWMDMAHEVYRRDGQTTFYHDFEALRRNPNGYVLFTPQFFCMARTIQWPCTVEQAVNPEWHWNNSNCWHIHVYAGDPKSIFTWMPFPLLYCSWEKKNRLRVYNLERMRSKLDV